MTSFADISSNQPGADLRAYAAGHDRILLKATEGATYTNPYFAAWWVLAGVLGLARGAYHFARPSASAGDVEADRFADLLVSVGGFGTRDWVVLDTEDDRSGGLERAPIHAAAFTGRLVARGYPTGLVYSYRPYLVGSRLTAALLPPGWRRLHLADYSAGTDASLTVPTGWTRAQIVARQYTDAASTPGIPGGSDYSRVLTEWLPTSGGPMADPKYATLDDLADWLWDVLIHGSKGFPGIPDIVARLARLESAVKSSAGTAAGIVEVSGQLTVTRPAPGS